VVTSAIRIKRNGEKCQGSEGAASNVFFPEAPRRVRSGFVDVLSKRDGSRGSDLSRKNQRKSQTPTKQYQTSRETKNALRLQRGGERSPRPRKGRRRRAPYKGELIVNQEKNEDGCTPQGGRKAQRGRESEARRSRKRLKKKKTNRSVIPGG